MTDEEIGFMPATELGEHIRRKAISPVEVMAAVLRRIDSCEPRINAFAHLEPDSAMAQARLAETALL